MRFIARRLIHSFFLLIGVTVLLFSFFHLAPGDYLTDIQMNPQISTATLNGLREQYGLNQSLPTQYVRWLGSVARGEFGYSFTYNAPVGPLLAVRLRNTLMLTAPALAFAWVLALCFGCWSAWNHNQWVDQLISGGNTFLLVMPDLSIALLLLLLALHSGWFSVGGMNSVNYEGLSWVGKLKDVFSHFTLPVLVLTLSSLPVLLRHVRSAVIEVLDTPYIQAARGHGIGPGRLLLRHVLPAAANPLLSLFGLSIASMLSGSLLIEVIMSWPGIGPLFLEAVFARDLYVILGSVIISTLILALSSLLVDGLLYFADPRIRLETKP